MQSISIKRPNWKAEYILGIPFFLLLIFVLHDYFVWNANLIIGLILAPYMCSLDRGKYSHRYLTPAICFVLILLFVPVKTPLFLAALFTFLYIVESVFGRTSIMLIILLLLVSPVFLYFCNFIGFPVRLWLSDIAAKIFMFAGTQTQSNGNIIVQGENEYSVDQACAGLNMLGTSLLLCLFILTRYQKMFRKRLHVKWIAVMLLATICFNIVCNLVRIVVLVQFNIPAESMYHDLAGIVSLLIYVIIPLLFITKKLVIRYGSALVVQLPPTAKHPKKIYTLLHLLLILPVVAISLNLKTMDDISHPVTNSNEPGFETTQLNNGILKLENTDCLIYIKSGTFYAPEHDPRICWKGSGYSFKDIKKENIGNYEIYIGSLEKGRDKIYSAWWFDNGLVKTINQFNWRWRAAKGEGPFFLINVNAQDQEVLKKITHDLLYKKSLIQ